MHSFAGELLNVVQAEIPKFIYCGSTEQQQKNKARIGENLASYFILKIANISHSGFHKTPQLFVWLYWNGISVEDNFSPHTIAKYARRNHCYIGTLSSKNVQGDYLLPGQDLCLQGWSIEKWVLILQMKLFSGRENNLAINRHQQIQSLLCNRLRPLLSDLHYDPHWAIKLMIHTRLLQWLNIWTCDCHCSLGPDNLAQRTSLIPFSFRVIQSVLCRSTQDNTIALRWYL